MLKFVCMLILRITLLPMTVPALLLTAAIEFASSEPDWVLWRNYNKYMILLLPWSKYT